jgi:hypothetical protein
MKVCSRIFQKPTEKPLRLEAPRRGYYRKAGKKLPHRIFHKNVPKCRGRLGESEVFKC